MQQLKMSGSSEEVCSARLWSEVERYAQALMLFPLLMHVNPLVCYRGAEL